jgi:hypothetical protein
MSDFVQQQANKCSFETSDSWVILSPIEQSIKHKIESVGTPLKDWDIQINYGIKTGFNDAFIIPTETRDQILNNCQTEDERKRTDELIRPILRGRDIKRYGYEWAELYLIATFPSRHYDIDDYPAVKSYLLSFGVERLEQTGIERVINGVKVKARKKTNNKWFEVQDSISYWEDFSKPKIVYMEIQTDNETSGYPFPCYSYDDTMAVALNTAYVMTSDTENIKYILGVLNSKTGRYLTKMYVTQLQQRQFRMLSQYVHKFPIVKPCNQIMDKVADLVQQRLITGDNIEIEGVINQIVFDLYGFTADEISFISAQ